MPTPSDLSSFGWQHLFGYAFSLIIGHIVISRLLDAAVPVQRNRSTTLLGLIERTLYTSVLIMGQLTFVAVWLGVKTAPELVSRWGEGLDQDRAIQQRRAFFNRWLSGTGLSLIYGIAGGQIVLIANWWDRIWLAVFVLVASFLAWLWLRRPAT